MFLGKATGRCDSALMWAHAEYVKILRSVVDNRVYDRLDPVVERYGNTQPRPAIEVWKINRQVRKVAARDSASHCGLVAVLVALEWTTNGTPPRDTSSIPTAVKLEYVDLEIIAAQKAPLRFTFYWPLDNQWQGTDYAIEVEQPTHADTTTRKAVAVRVVRQTFPCKAKSRPQNKIGQPGGKSSIAEQPLELLCINTVRTLAMDAVQKANSGHPGHAHGSGSAGFRAVGSLSAAQSHQSPTGLDAIASSSPMVMPACCCMPCSTSPATTCRSTT